MERIRLPLERLVDVLKGKNMKTLLRCLVMFFWTFILMSPARAEELDRMLDYVNNARHHAGLPALEQDEGLYEAAAIRARELSRVYSHTRPDGRNPGSVIKDNGIPFRKAGENIAYGEGIDTQAFFTNWMNSPGHRRNIMSPDFEFTGIGRYQDRNGRVYWVQLFVRYE